MRPWHSRGRMEATVKPSHFEIIKQFDQLPDDAIVPDPVARLVLNESERSWRRNRPVRRIAIGERRGGARVGDIRALVRGEQAATT
jgi:hypothetical protein